MNSPVFLCPAEELTEGRYRELSIELDGQLEWFIGTRIDGQARAWFNTCPHQGRPLNFAPDRFLSDDQNRLVCAHHGAVFDPKSSRCVSGPCVNDELRAVQLLEREQAIYLITPA